MSELAGRAVGRWRDILGTLGVPHDVLNGKHQACPFCGDGGKGRLSDRFRFDDQGGKGSFICSHCGAGMGVEFVRRFRGLATHSEAWALIETVIGSAKAEAPKREASAGWLEAKHLQAWQMARPLETGDPVTLWLAGRGIVMEKWPAMLRYEERARYWTGDKAFEEHPAMLARFVGPSATKTTVHRTFLDGFGRKAKVPKVRLIAKGPVPEGGAVRLAASAERMGVATGIETALAAMLMFKLPIWATTTDALLLGWKPPETCKHLVIFGDNDRGFGGQAAAYGAAYRITSKTEGRPLETIEVRIPEAAGEDWNDVWMVDQGMKPGST